MSVQALHAPPYSNEVLAYHDSHDKYRLLFLRSAQCSPKISLISTERTLVSRHKCYIYSHFKTRVYTRMSFSPPDSGKYSVCSLIVPFNHFLPLSSSSSTSSHVSGLSSPVSPVGQLNRDVEEDDVFMQLELPLERDSGSSGESSPLGETSPPPVSSPQSRDALMSDLYPQVRHMVPMCGYFIHKNYFSSRRIIG